MSAKKRGRPTTYNRKIADCILDRIVQGESVRGICRDDDMPNAGTVFRWLARHEEFSQQYARAKEESAEADQDRLDEIAEKVLDGELEPQAARVAADIIKWSASKKRPKKYGDRLAVGGDDNMPPIGIIKRTIVD